MSTTRTLDHEDFNEARIDWFLEREDLPGGSSRIWIRIVADGEDAGRLCFLSQDAFVIDAWLRGDKSMRTIRDEAMGRIRRAK